MFTQATLQRIVITLTVFPPLFVSRAWSVCRVPRPRLVCSELANSEAVVEAKLIESRYVPQHRDLDGYVYRLQRLKLFAGQIPVTFTVWEENSSGRAGFYWKKDETYVLFLTFSKVDHAWVIDGCGNSGPIGESASVIAAIESAKRHTGDALIGGMVSTDSWTTGVPDATVTVTGKHIHLSTTTDQKGNFEFRVPPGHYEVQAAQTGSVFDPNPLSYENPSSLKLAAGGCAQVQFSGENKP